MSWFSAANTGISPSDNSASRSLKSWKNLLSNPHYICQNNCSWFKEKKLSQFCIPSKKLTGNHTQIYGVAIHVVCWGFCPSRNDVYCPRIRTACFARISRGVPRVAFSFTITLYLVRMKRKSSAKNRKEWEKLPRTSINANLSCFGLLWTFNKKELSGDLGNYFG